MEGLALKLVLTPALIGAVSMAGRRWGPGISGWLVGFPLTSGPVAFFLALDQGVSFAAGAAVGSMTGAAAQAVFCVLYGRRARGRRWAPALLAGSLGFAAATVLLQLTTLALLPLLVLVLLTALAPVLGPSLTGLLATYPLYGAILAGFAHHLEGPGPAIRVLRGLLLGLFAFAGFFFVLALMFERAGIGRAFSAAIVSALVLQAGALWAMRRDCRAPRLPLDLDRPPR